MKDNQQEFLIILKKYLPADFEKFINQEIKYNSGQVVSNPLYYMNNILGFRGTLKQKLEKLELKTLEPILSGFLNSLTNFYQDLFLVFVHSYNQNYSDFDNCLVNYYNSIEEIKIHNDKILGLKYTLKEKELRTGFIFIVESINSLITYTKQFSNIDLKKSPLCDSLFKLIHLFEQSYKELNTINFFNQSDAKQKKPKKILYIEDCLQENIVKNKKKFVKDIISKFQNEERQELYMLINELINHRVLIIGKNNKGAFYKGLKNIFPEKRLGVPTNMNPSIVIHLNDNTEVIKYKNLVEKQKGIQEKIIIKLHAVLKNNNIQIDPIINPND